MPDAREAYGLRRVPPLFCCVCVRWSIKTAVLAGEMPDVTLPFCNQIRVSRVTADTNEFPDHRFSKL